MIANIRASLLLVLALASTVAWGSPQQDYVLHCQGCHLADGSGNPPDIPDFRNRLGYFLRLPEGKAYLIQVPGASQALIDDARLAALTNWMLESFAAGSLPDALEPYDAAFVGRYRRDPPADIDAERERFDVLIDALVTGE